MSPARTHSRPATRPGAELGIAHVGGTSVGAHHAEPDEGADVRAVGGHRRRRGRTVLLGMDALLQLSAGKAPRGLTIACASPIIGLTHDGEGLKTHSPRAEPSEGGATPLDTAGHYDGTAPGESGRNHITVAVPPLRPLGHGKGSDDIPHADTACLAASLPDVLCTRSATSPRPRDRGPVRRHTALSAA